MNSAYQPLVLLIGLYFTLAASTSFDPCVTGASPFAVRVTNCSELPCDLKSGTNMVLDMDFGVSHDVEKLTAKVRAVALGAEVVYPLPQPDACLGLTNGECPLDAGEEVTYRLTMPILDSFPKNFCPVCLEEKETAEQILRDCEALLGLDRLLLGLSKQ